MQCLLWQLCACLLEKWSNPSIIGQCIPPVSDFILEKINNTRAVLFGGGESNDNGETL